MKKYKVQSVLLALSLVVSSICVCVAQPCINKDLTDLDEADIEQYLDQKARACLVNLADGTVKELQLKVAEYKTVIKKYDEINADDKGKKLEVEIQNVINGKIKYVQDNLDKTSGPADKINEDLKTAEATVKEAKSNLARIEAEYNKAKANLEAAEAKHQGIQDQQSKISDDQSALNTELQQYKALLKTI